MSLDIDRIKLAALEEILEPRSQPAFKHAKNVLALISEFRFVQRRLTSAEQALYKSLCYCPSGCHIYEHILAEEHFKKYPDIDKFLDDNKKLMDDLADGEEE